MSQGSAHDEVRSMFFVLIIFQNSERDDLPGKALKSMEVWCGSRYRKAGDYVVVGQSKGIDDHVGVRADIDK